jgi:hypothetical protein
MNLGRVRLGGTLSVAQFDGDAADDLTVVRVGVSAMGAL